jgi:hypothetical protein
MWLSRNWKIERPFSDSIDFATVVDIMANKEQAKIVGGTTVITSLSAEEARQALLCLFYEKKDWQAEILVIAKEVTNNPRFEDVLAEVSCALANVDEDTIFAKSGRKHGRYREPEEVAADLLTECLKPFLERLRKIAKNKPEQSGLAFVQAIIAALYNYSHDDNFGELEDCVLEVCGDSADWAKWLWLSGGDESNAANRIPRADRTWPEDFGDKFAPDWKFLSNGV